MIFWVAVWFMMAAAFTTAWVFIVKGCETLDEKNPTIGGADNQSH